MKTEDDSFKPFIGPMGVGEPQRSCSRTVRSTGGRRLSRLPDPAVRIYPRRSATRYLIWIVLAACSILGVPPAEGLTASRVQIVTEDAASPLLAKTKSGTADFHSELQPKSGQRPQGPTLALKADKNSVLAGQNVTFTLEPANLAVNSPYIFTFDFGDRTKAVKAPNQAGIVHQYKTQGSYTVSVSVEAPRGQEIFVPKPIVANSVKVDVHALLAAPPLILQPKVNLTVNPAVADVGQPVSFQARVVPDLPNLFCRFVFGDGTKPTVWSNDRQTTHTYSGAGLYPARAEIQGGGVHGIVASDPRQINIMLPPPPKIPTVRLTPNPRKIIEGQSVTFVTRIDPDDPALECSIVFGDSSKSSEWSVNRQTTHTYFQAESYPAQALVRGDGISGAIASASVQIDVTAPTSPSPGSSPAGSTPTVTLTVNPIQAEVGRAVSFQAQTTQDNPSIRVRFVFGDGTLTEWTTDRQATHTYSSAATYDAYAQVGRVSNGAVTVIADSSRKQVSVSNVAGGIPWWVYIAVIAAVLLFGAYQAWNRLFPPRPTMVPFPNRESLDFRDWKEPQIDLQIRLNHNVDDGEYQTDTLQGYLVLFVRSHNV